MTVVNVLSCTASIEDVKRILGGLVACDRETGRGGQCEEV